MTITPTTPAPAAPAPGAADPTVADTCTSGGFLALVQQALATALGQGPAGPRAAIIGGKDTEHGDPTTGPAEPNPADLALAAATNGLTAVVPPTALAPTILGPAGAAAPGAPGASATVAARAGGVRASASGAQPRGAVATAPATTPDEAVPSLDSGSPTGSAARRPVAGTHAAPGQPDLPAAPATGAWDTSGRPASTDVPATAAPAQAPAPPTSSAPAHRATTTAHVTAQVFPEVTSLVRRGDGAHRITLTLTPESLGEVRVVMTVRDGSVHVRLAAGHEAQAALLDGSHELTRLLQQTGASETRIVVRDLPAATQAGSAGPDLGGGQNRPQDQQAQNQQLAGQQLTGQNTQDHHAGTRAQQHPATDGTNDSSTPLGANPPLSIEPVTFTRAAGVDVTM